MTKIALKSNEIISKIEVNGRHAAFARRITSIEKVGPGRWSGFAGGRPFAIEGGKAAGGSARDWFLDWDVIGDTMICTSAAECIKMIETA